ncbi:hypothetical protein Snov_0028 [Ancylobacter novellus DSM 506]|uniref:Uncharacterized protein n=1 Tax=Ancylobacter novellus (strain ATCC 8093 / DSM 506 / JCM 20403 / CCM 1077 / IAM 12100 / NBRC 12443 / NCIMB 10456) TaxID=639283 RepID=D6ZZV1_ANCN5|nr:phage tail protein [Ancylobacter novellus]ADH87365.1 hypothetical protein Snov_0028 [Ancylobacter novellus DSM 506]
MPFIAPIIGAVGAAIGAVGSFVGSLGIVGQALLGIGASVLSSVIQKETAGKAEKQPGGVQFERQYGGDVPRQVACGLVGIAGHDTYVNTFGPANGILQQIYTLSDFPCHGLSRVAINGKWVTLGPVGEDGMRKVTSGEYADLIRVQFVDGTQTAALAGLVNSANPSDRWTANHIGAGVAYVYIALAFTEPLTNFPDFFFEFYGARFYDWRKDSTVGGSGGHRWGNYATYEFTENPVVIEYNYRRGIAWNGDMFCGMAMPAADLPLAKWTAAANICDETTDYGTRYRCSIMLDCTAMHGENITSLQLSCGAKKVDAVDGSWPLVGHDQAVVATITDDDLIVGVRGRWTARRSMSDLVNRVYGTFPNPDNLWSPADYELQGGGALVVLDRRDRDVPLDFPMVRVPGQAAQLARIYLEENRYEATGDEVWRPRFQVLEPGDWIRRIGRTHGDRIYQITGLSLASHDADGPRNVSVSLQEVDGAIYDGITAPPIVVPMPPGAPVLLNEVQDFDLAPVTVLGDDGRLLPAIRASWASITDVTVAYVDLQYWPTAQPTSVFTKRVPATETITVLAEGVVRATEYTVRTRLVTQPPRVTVWSAGETVTTTAIPDTEIDVYLANIKGDAYDALRRMREDLTANVQRMDMFVRDTSVGLGRQVTSTSVATRLGKANATAIQSVQSSVQDLGDQVLAMAEIIDAVNASIESINGTLAGQASAMTALTARVTASEGGINALAASTTTLSATVGDLSASGLLRIEARAGSGDVSARLVVLMRATTGSVWREVGTIWETGFTGGNPALPFARIANYADQFVIISPIDDGRLPPFVVDTGLGQVIITEALIKRLMVNNFTLTGAGSKLLITSNPARIRATS